ncbi:cysteine desulfurase family protein [Parafrankia sp. BMG5.11]|uniref:cysteine desulfurase family protein n=1 Tax=Parafrankia sp. BMG5.11 TaxID=222540 RepID=UPI001404CE72|nr:cysteine desulfurase family protein [Parafrankia sp. BMG5.11]
MTIYLDYQSSTPVDPRVRAVMMEVMEQDFANPSSESHSAGWSARARVEEARATIARAVGCAADEIVFTSGATEADNIGVLGAAMGAPEGRRRILIGATEHKAVLESAFAAQRLGFAVELLPVDRNGMIELAHLQSKLGSDVAVVSVMWVNNEIGTIQQLEPIVRESAAFGAFVHTDATQAPAALPIDLTELGVDAASFSSHKIYGPKGVGALYLSAASPWRPKPLLFGGGQEQGLRPGTLPTPLCVGFAEAFSIMASEGSVERARVQSLRDELAKTLQGLLPEVQKTIEDVPQHPGTLHIRVDGINADDLLSRLQPHLAASTGSACTSGRPHNSHVLEALGLSSDNAASGLRLSLGRFTTREEINETASILRAAFALLRPTQ